jgi:hypothetical protein
MRAHARKNRLPALAALAATALVVVFRGRPRPARTPRTSGRRAGDTGGADPAEAAAVDPGDESGNEYPVDLERLRARISDNLYWRLGAPSKDPQVLQARAEEEQRWNQLYGKVLSGTASEEEIRRYYDHRR